MPVLEPRVPVRGPRSGERVRSAGSRNERVAVPVRLRRRGNIRSVTGQYDPRTRSAASGTDLEVARQVFMQAYGGTGFVAEQTERSFSYRLRSVGDGIMSLNATRYDARMAGETASADAYSVTWTSEGGGVIDVGRQEVELTPGMPVVFPTGQPFRFDLADVRQNVIQFDRGFLEGIAAEMHGTQPGPLEFEHAVRPRSEDVRAWNLQVQDTARVVLGAGPVSELAFAETSRATALAFLRTFPHRVLAPEALVPQGATGRVRGAIEYIHAHAHTPITTTDVAEHVGLSMRGLQQAFQRQVGTAPNAVLRGIRLDRVRDELRRGRPGDVTVAAVAVHWGFAHLGRFSAAYAQRFGEYPRDTLHS